MDVEDSTVELFKDLLRGSGILEGDEICVGGKVIHNDHDRWITIRFVERAGEVSGLSLVGFVGLRDSKRASIG